VIRRSIGPAAAAPNWRWPTQTTRLLRGFGSGDARGIDIAVNSGDAVYAAADGEVVYSGRGVQGSGDLIILRHSDRYLSAYAHNSVMLVEEGSRVIAGDKIAEAGTTPAGEALLHFEIREDGKSIDPVGLLPRR
jgi:lipoprotein NlpD